MYLYQFSIFLILLRFIRDYPRHFISLIFILFIELLIAIVSVISIVPLADYLLNPELQAPNKITEYLVNFLNHNNIEANLTIFIIIFKIYMTFTENYIITFSYMSHDNIKLGYFKGFVIITVEGIHKMT